MSDVRCPMCGKLNPEELEVCQFCEARLKPLFIQPAEDENSSGEIAPESSEQPTSPAETRDLGQSGTDWLDSLRPEEADEEEDLPFEYAEQELPEWLRRGETARLDSEEETGSQAEEDWLEDLRPAADSLEQGIGGSERSHSPWEEDLATQAASVADWLKGLPPEVEGSPGSTVELTPSEMEDDKPPDWLQRIRERRDEESGPAEPVDKDPDAEAFLASLRSSQYEEQTPSTTRSLQDEESEEGEPLPDEALGEEESDLPDWLMMGSDESAEPAQEAELPEWLRDISKGKPEEELPGTTSRAPKATVDLGLPPDEEEWQPVDEEVEPSSTDDWLAALGGSAVKETADLEDVPVEEIPPVEQLSLAEEEPPVGEGLPAEEDFLAREEFQAQETGFDRRAKETAQLGEDLELGEEEGELEAVAPFTFDDEDEPLVTGELPDWFAAGQEQEGEERGRAQAESAEEELAPGQLPGWLKAMRPVEAVTPQGPIVDERDQQIERSGPLAGLRGVLPAEPEIARQKTPSSYATRLQVSENHQSHASLFGELIRAEGKGRALPSKPRISPQHLLRWGVFILVAVVILLPLVTGTTLSPLPLAPAEVGAARDLINALPGEGAANVLLAVDYDPGLSGEMIAASSSVIDHLMIKGAFLAIVSTTPAGPAQAELLVQGVNRSAGHDYRPGVQYLNLGYVPGGAAGLMGFARAPHQVMPLSIDGHAIWETERLVGIKNISDFDLALVVTESPETARAWIEQVQPVLGMSPMVMVVSAQAEPFVRTYYATQPRRVQGLVSGVIGGAAYEGGMPRTGPARVYWDAFSLGILVAVVVIFAAAIVNGVMFFLRGKPAGMGGA